MTQQSSTIYDPNSIVHLTPVQHVRKCPRRYLGGTDVRSLNQMIYTVIDSALDDVLIGNCNEIRVSLLPNNEVLVEDNAPGISVLPADILNTPILEVLMTQRIQRGRRSVTDIRFPGIGLMPVNALCRDMRVDICTHGSRYRQLYRKGVPTTPIERIGPALFEGNTFTFRPDFTIMDRVDFDAETLIERCKMMAANFPGLRITVSDKRQKKHTHTVLHAPNGGRDYLKIWAAREDTLGEVHIAEGNHPVRQADGIIQVQVAFQWRQQPRREIIAFTNSEPTSANGRSIRAIRQWLSLYKGKRPADTNGYIAVVGIIHPAPQYDGFISNQVALTNFDAADAVYTVLSDKFGKVYRPKRQAPHVAGKREPRTQD